MDYKKSGVDIEKADMLTEMIRETVNSDNIGMFAGIYDYPFIPEYYLAGCTDGVGTKVIPLIERNLIDTIAKDLIAMNLNDLVCTGAKPLFFLDYFATSSLDVEVTAKFVKSLKNELAKYKCTLLGGETAELNDLVTKGHFDVAGFAVGIVRKDKLLKKDSVQEGDFIIGLKSSGPHSNGYTLIRKLHDLGHLTDKELLMALEPTHIYVNEIIELCDRNLIKVCAHITGGGLADNLARVIPDKLCAEIFKKNIPEMPIFKKIESVIGQNEAYKTFNMGVGMCIVATQQNLADILKICSDYEPFILGRIVKDEKGSSVWLG